MQKYHNLENVFWRDNILCMTVNGKLYEIKNILQLSSKLSNATEYERNTFDVCPTGYGIHWSLIDEDLSIDGLLNIPHKYKVPEKAIM